MIEKMADFFDARVEGYEAHMFENVGSADVYYKETAKCFPIIKEMKLLDLGCGTGLELDELFPLMPDMQVTGVDMSGKMLDKLRQKHADRNLTLIQGDYSSTEFPPDFFDAAVAVQTMHHFREEEKLRLYRKILTALKPGGMYVETDYTAGDWEEEQAMLLEADRLIAETGDSSTLFHIDVPFTAEHQLTLLRRAGFTHVKLVWKKDAAAVITALKA